jgi:hypothetical protein
MQVSVSRRVFWLVKVSDVFAVSAVRVMTNIVALMMEAVSISEMSVNFYQAVRRNVSEGINPLIFKVSVTILTSAVAEEVNRGIQWNWFLTPSKSLSEIKR